MDDQRMAYPCGFCLVAGVGLEPHDLRVMSPTSYQLLHPAIFTFRCYYVTTNIRVCQGRKTANVGMGSDFVHIMQKQTLALLTY